MKKDGIQKIIKDKPELWEETALQAINNGGAIDGSSLEKNKGLISSLISYFESVGNYEACILLFEKFKTLV